MAKTVPVEVRVADLPQMQQFIGSVATLLKTMAKCDLPLPVAIAADQLRRDVAALGGTDIGPPPGASDDEDRIRDAMAGARDHPGRTVTT